MANVENEIQDTNDNSENSEADKKLANLVNSAVSSHLKRTLGKALPEMLDSILSEKLGAFQQSAAQVDKKGKSVEPDDDKATKAELEALKNQLKAEKQKAREKEVFSDVRSKISGKLRPEAIDLALKVLKADNKIELKRDGSAIFKHEGEEMELEEGLSAWLESKETVLFRPSPIAQPGKKTPFKAPARNGATAGTVSQDPMQRTAEMLAKLGLKL